MNTLTPFESTLLSELRSHVAERAAAPATRRRRSAAAAAAAGIAALATGIGITTMGGSPAFAVATSAEGDVVVRIHELTDADGLERALADQGVTADVAYGGDAGNSVMIDSSGKVTTGDAPTGDAPSGGELSEGGRTDTSEEGGAPASASPQGEPPAAAPCGNAAELPVAVSRDGDDYLITIDGDSSLAKETLSITTLSRGDSADIVVSFAPVDGLMCALGTSSR